MPDSPTNSIIEVEKCIYCTFAVFVDEPFVVFPPTMDRKAETAHLKCHMKKMKEDHYD